MTIVAEIFDKFMTSHIFLVTFKIGEEKLGVWEWSAKNFRGKFMRRIRFPFKFKYLN
jgi:hypothetical protein